MPGEAFWLLTVVFALAAAIGLIAIMRLVRLLLG